MKLEKPKAILFDWDNTLVNTWPVIHEALNKTFGELGYAPWTLELVKQRVARSMRDSFPAIFGENWQAAGDKYQQHFRAIHLERLEALEGAMEVLDFLRKQPLYIAIVSNKKGINLRKEVTHIGWDKYFDKVIGADDTPRDKPAPDPVYAALEGSGIKAGPDVWFVGDSPVDMEVAHATGCVPIWYGGLPDKLEHAYHGQFNSHSELAVLLQQLF